MNEKSWRRGGQNHFQMYSHLMYVIHNKSFLCDFFYLLYSYFGVVMELTYCMLLQYIDSSKERKNPQLILVILLQLSCYTSDKYQVAIFTTILKSKIFIIIKMN